jgi:hypothetical protein
VTVSHQLRRSSSLFMALTCKTEAQEKMTPDSQKSTLQQTKETLTGTADKAARYVSSGIFHNSTITSQTFR